MTSVREKIRKLYTSYSNTALSYLEKNLAKKMFNDVGNIQDDYKLGKQMDVSLD